MNDEGYAWSVVRRLCISSLSCQILIPPRHITSLFNRQVMAIFKTSMQLLLLLLLPQQAASEVQVTPERIGPGPSSPPNPHAGWILRDGQ